MIDLMREMLSFAFMTRALLVGCIVSVCAALLGVSLVLKRYSMIGDGLSHVSFGAVSIGMALGFAPLAFAIPVVIVAALLLLRLSENSKIKGDAAIGMISVSALAVGVVVLSLARGVTADVNSYLFGSVLVLTGSDVALSVALGLCVLLLYILLYRRIFAVTFDESFARATGVRADLLNMLLAAMTAVTIVLGIRLMGAMLISSLIVFPALAAMRVCRSFRTVAITAALVSVAGFMIGMVVSYSASTPAGASVVLADACLFLVFSMIRQLRARGVLRGVALD